MYRSEHEERAVFLWKKKGGAAVFCLVLISLSPPRLSHTFTPFHSLSLPFFHSGSGAAGSSSWLSASCPGSRTRGASGTKSSRKRKVSSFFFPRFFLFSLALSLETSALSLTLFLSFQKSKLKKPQKKPNAPSSSSITSPTWTASPSSACSSPAAPRRDRSRRCPSSGSGRARCSFCSSSEEEEEEAGGRAARREQVWRGARALLLLTLLLLLRLLLHLLRARARRL